MRIGVNLLNFGPGVSPESLAGWTELAHAGRAGARPAAREAPMKRRKRAAARRPEILAEVRPT